MIPVGVCDFWGPLCVTSWGLCVIPGGLCPAALAAQSGQAGPKLGMRANCETEILEAHCQSLFKQNNVAIIPLGPRLLSIYLRVRVLL